MVSSFWSTCGTSRLTFRSHYFNTSNGNAYSSKKNTETGWLNLFQFCLLCRFIGFVKIVHSVNISHMTTAKNRGWTLVVQKCNQFLLHMCNRRVTLVTNLTWERNDFCPWQDTFVRQYKKSSYVSTFITSFLKHVQQLQWNITFTHNATNLKTWRFSMTQTKKEPTMYSKHERSHICFCQLRDQLQIPH
jgi:hypothetical protein